MIFVSLNGETKELITAAENCYEAEIGTILLTANRHSSLMAHIEIPFWLASNQKAPSFQTMKFVSRLPLSILARIFARRILRCGLQKSKRH